MVALSLSSPFSQKGEHCKSHDSFRRFSCLFTSDTGLSKWNGMGELICFILSAIISPTSVSTPSLPRHLFLPPSFLPRSSLPPLMNGHILRCAAGRLCARPGRAPETRNDGTPRHQCMNCRKPMCGGVCGVQLMDDAERAKRGFVFPITSLHPDGQDDFKQTNNEHVLICFFVWGGEDEGSRELQRP